MEMERFTDPAEFESKVSNLEQMLLEHLRGEGAGERPINSQLLLVAAMARQLMDRLRRQAGRDATWERKCGRYQDHRPDKLPRNDSLNFYRACNAIIHADTYRYDLHRSEDRFLLAIHGTWQARRDVIQIRTDLYGMAFTQSCRILSSAVARHDGGAVQDGTATYAPGAALEETAMTEKSRATANGRDAKNVYVYNFDMNNTCIELGATLDLGARQDELIREHVGFHPSIEQVRDELFTRAEAERYLKEMQEDGWPVNMDTLKALEG